MIICKCNFEFNINFHWLSTFISLVSEIFGSVSCEASGSADVHVFMLSCQDFNIINMQHVPLHEFKT